MLIFVQRDGPGFASTVFPLTLSTPASAVAGTPFTVTVNEQRPDGTTATPTFSGKSERFRLNDRARCGAPHGFRFSVGDRSDVDYRLPSKLPRGRYVLDVKATDNAFNRDDVRRRGSNRVVFRVR